MRWLAVAALVAASFSVAAPAGAQGRGRAELSLASQTAWVTAGRAFTIRVDVDRVRRPQELDLRVTVHRSVTSRSQFTRTLEGESLRGIVHRDVVPFGGLRFDAGGAVPITLPLDLRPGVYPVVVAVLDDGDVVSSLVTHLVRVPDELVELPLAVAWIQRYGVDPALAPDGTVTLGPDQLDELRTVAAQLAGGVPLTVVPTPETIAALATVDDGRTVAALERLLGGHQVLAAPFVDVDASALARRGELARQRLVGARVLGDVLGVAGDTGTWSLTGPVTGEVLEALAELGVRNVIVDEERLVPLGSAVTGGLTLARPFALAGPGFARFDAAAPDPGLSAHFEGDEVLAAHHLLADLAVLYFDAPGIERGVVVRPPDGWRPSEAVLSIALASLRSSPILEPVTVDTLFNTVEPITGRDGEAIERTPLDGEPASLGFSATELARARGAIEGFASLTDSSRDLIDGLERLVLVAQSSDLTRAARRAYLGGVHTRVADAAANVRVLGARTYRLTAREGTIPLTLVNDNDFDVRVAVELTSDKLEFTGQRVDEITLRAKSTVTQAVPVKALTSGAFPLGVTVRSPNGLMELSRTRLTITSTVASGVGVVLSVGAALFLLLWWGSHWRTVRRAGRLVPQD